MQDPPLLGARRQRMGKRTIFIKGIDSKDVRKTNHAVLVKYVTK